MIASMKSTSLGKGPLKNLGKAMTIMHQCVEKQSTGENIYIEPNFPRFLYHQAAQFGWRKLIKHNGLKTKDLNRQHW